jgi:hypothetical protein
MSSAQKKKGRTEVRPKFREEKPEGLAIRGPKDLHRESDSKARFVKKWLMATLFLRAHAIFFEGPMS